MSRTHWSVILIMWVLRCIMHQKHLIYFNCGLVSGWFWIWIPGQKVGGGNMNELLFILFIVSRPCSALEKSDHLQTRCCQCGGLWAVFSFFFFFFYLWYSPEKWKSGVHINVCIEMWNVVQSAAGVKPICVLLLLHIILGGCRVFVACIM